MTPTREQVEAAMAYGEYRLTEKQWDVLQLGSGECMDRRASMHLAAEVRRLEQENAALRKALEPFAEKAQRILDGKRGPLALTSDETMYAVEFSDLRRAARALKGRP